MRRFRVISLSVGGRRKVHKYDEIVTENDFPKGNANELVSKGFLQELESERVEEVIPDEPIQDELTVAEDEPIQDEPAPVFYVMRNNEMKPVYTFEDANLTEIKLELSRRAIEHNANERSRKKLFDLFK